MRIKEKKGIIPKGASTNETIRTHARPPEYIILKKL